MYGAAAADLVGLGQRQPIPITVWSRKVEKLEPTVRGTIITANIFSEEKWATSKDFSGKSKVVLF